MTRVYSILAERQRQIDATFAIHLNPEQVRSIRSVLTVRKDVQEKYVKYLFAGLVALNMKGYAVIFTCDNPKDKDVMIRLSAHLRGFAVQSLFETLSTCAADMEFFTVSMPLLTV